MAKEYVDKGGRDLSANAAESTQGSDTGMDIGDLELLFLSRWKLLVLGPLSAGLLAVGITHLIPPTYTASRTFMPPQQAQDVTTLALASFGLLAGLAGGADENRNTVIRANGRVVSAPRTRATWLSKNAALTRFNALPSDTVFVPEDQTKMASTQGAKELTQVLVQLGAGLAGTRKILP